MTTVRDICTWSLRLIGVASAGEAPAAEDMAEAVAAYNALLHGAVADGWLATHADQTASDTFALGDGLAEPLASAVAVRLASAYSLAPAAQVRVTAALFPARLAAADREAAGATRFPPGVWNPRPGTWGEFS